MKYLPNLDEALEWCRHAGVNMDWGGATARPELFECRALPLHDGTRELASIKKLVVHRSGFSCGNAAMIRWYHRIINHWHDIGYHLVIGNGLKGYSVAGGVELGRPLGLLGAHCRGHNDASIAICLVDNLDHFRKIPPSKIELHALENALLYFLEKAEAECEIVGHSDLTGKNCPGKAVPVKKLSQLVKSKRQKVRYCEPDAVTVDLRHLFSKEVIDYARPREGIKKLIASGTTRLVYPFHWLNNPWEDIQVAREWTKAAHAENLDLLLYTGPFGTEHRSFLEKMPGSSKWLQKKKDGSPATYDPEGNLLMFCPASSYFVDYRLPIINEFIRETDCDGVFFDIPWIMRDACYCENCRGVRGDAGSHQMDAKEVIVREALAQAVLAIKNECPDAWLAANAAASRVWDTKTIGATPFALSGLFDELVVEWTPSKKVEIESIRKSIDYTRVAAPACRISHAWIPEKAGEFMAALNAMNIDMGVGKWHVVSQI